MLQDVELIANGDTGELLNFTGWLVLACLAALILRHVQ
jgi:hypothetical protein